MNSFKLIPIYHYTWKSISSSKLQPKGNEVTTKWMVAKRWSSISSGNKVICVCPSTKLETPSIPFRKEFIISHEEEPFGTERGSSVLAPAEENDFEQIELSTLDSLLERCKNTCSESPIRYKQCSSQGALRKLGYYHIFSVFEHQNTIMENWYLIQRFFS